MLKILEYVFCVQFINVINRHFGTDDINTASSLAVRTSKTFSSLLCLKF